MLRAPPAACAALFVETLSKKVQSFRKNGYVLIRSPSKNQMAASAHTTALASLQQTILHYFHEEKTTWRYQWWRFWNSVSTPELRHALPLPGHLIGLKSTLHTSINHVLPFLDTQLHGNSAVVELNALISLPGSPQQLRHCDIKWEHRDRFILTGFIALDNVSTIDGPTVVFSESHSEQFHAHMMTSHRLDNEIRVYNSDGSDDLDGTGIERPLTHAADSGELLVVTNPGPEVMELIRIENQAPLEVTKQ